ncbi:MAG: hypothetical protein JWN86_3939 [Planctomycetota bacterium]|nr:hypothetical protein [Planctomycetota bacterium]
MPRAALGRNRIRRTSWSRRWPDHVRADRASDGKTARTRLVLSSSPWTSKCSLPCSPAPIRSRGTNTGPAPVAQEARHGPRAGVAITSRGRRICDSKRSGPLLRRAVRPQRDRRQPEYLDRNDEHRPVAGGQVCFFYASLAPGVAAFSPVRNVNKQPSKGFSLASDDEGNVTDCWLTDRLHANVSHDEGRMFGANVEIDPAYNPCNCCTTSAGRFGLTLAS